MEFENNSIDKSTDISDADRFSATTKKIQLTPIHEVVEPDALPSGTASDTYGINTTIPTESEDTSNYQRTTVPAAPDTTPAAKTTKTGLIIVTLCAVVALVTAGIYFLAR